MNAWLTSSLTLLLIWIIIWLVRPSLRKEMLLVSIFTMALGFTEPLFVPKYWNPPSLFNLASRAGFDIESFIFAFSIGGIAAVLYEVFAKEKHVKISHREMSAKRHRFHLLAITSPLIIFVALFLLTTLNPIYSASIAMSIGAIAAIFCRPDLKRKVIIGSLLFFGLYFVFFLLFISVYPGIVEQIWNLNEISGILILGIPLEELIFALTAGALWASYYEHINWYKLVRVRHSK